MSKGEKLAEAGFHGVRVELTSATMAEKYREFYEKMLNSPGN